MQHTTGNTRSVRQGKQVVKRLRAFTLVELLIVVVILGIIATVVIPAYQDSAGDVMTGVMNTNLKGIRQAIERFNVDHGEYPLILDDWYRKDGYQVNTMTQLACKTNANGDVNPSGQHGPYLRGVSTGPNYDDLVLPPNPFVEKYRGAQVAGGVTDTLGEGGDWEDAQAGWVYGNIQGVKLYPWEPAAFMEGSTARSESRGTQ